MRIDIGSGMAPVPEADVLVERYLGSDNRQRRKSMQVRPNQSVVQADVTNLPFADRSVDYAWCICVLEHLRFPHLAAEEIQRVARAGIVACPHPNREAAIIKVHPDHYHLWIVEAVPNGLRFHRRDTETLGHITHRASPGIPPPYCNNKMAWATIPFDVEYCSCSRS